VIVLRSGELAFANLPARALFGLGAADVGKPLADFDVARSPGALQPAIEQVLRERRRVPLGDVAFRPPRGEERRLEITVTPLLTSENKAAGALITFEDVTRYARMQDELETNRRDLQLAYEELQTTIDELETTNEELQSANEELQTTNEELHSSNEELETMNDELQSANEELETINDELRQRTGELNEVNDFLEVILTSLRVGVAVLDEDQRVRAWNRQAEELWGLRAAEAIEHHFFNLDIGLPHDGLGDALRNVLARGSAREQLTLPAVNRRGRSIECVTTVLPLVSDNDGRGNRHGAIVLMEDRPLEARDGN
jgi:two-component system CheB/CheR fusion protein